LSRCNNVGRMDFLFYGKFLALFCILSKYFLWLFIVAIAAVALLSIYLRLSRRFRSNKQKYLAFFHPYCDAGGGGERVLWMMVQALLLDCDENAKSNSPIRDMDIVIYTGDIDRTKEQIINNVESKFGISYEKSKLSRIRLVYIRSRFLLEAKYYPVATMIGQSLGSMIVGFECLIRCPPDYYFDTTGAPFTYPLAKYISGCGTVLAYVHYPVISKDMIEKVRERRPDHNNNTIISSSVTVSTLKLIYYQIFSFFFSLAGRCASNVMVNGTWTCDHIASLWDLTESMISIESPLLDAPARGKRKSRSRRLVKIYPPCNTTHLQNSPLEGRQR
jgi:alpha-1,2-mannosyltransferase